MAYTKTCLPARSLLVRHSHGEGEGENNSNSGLFGVKALTLEDAQDDALDVGGRAGAVSVEIGAGVVGGARQGHVHDLLTVYHIDITVPIKVTGALFGRVEEEIGI